MEPKQVRFGQTLGSSHQLGIGRRHRPKAPWLPSGQVKRKECQKRESGVFARPSRARSNSRKMREQSGR